MTEAEMIHRRVVRMKAYLGEKSQFYQAMVMMEKGLTDREVAEALALERPRKERREIEADTMKVLRKLLNGTASKGTKSLTWHVETVEEEGSKASERRKAAYAMLDRGAMKVELMRELHISNWLAGEYVEQWKLEREIEKDVKE